MINGSLVALVTPMHINGTIDWAGLERLVDYHLTNGTSGIVVAGTTGESSALKVEELNELIRLTVSQVSGKIPVIVGTGCASTEKTIELTELAQKLGADAALVITPYYVKPTQEGLYRHFSTLAKAVTIPQILYNVPGRTAVDLMPETISRLACEGNIIAIKEATGSIQRARNIIELCGNRMDVLSGDDASAVELILQGGCGVISVTANIAPSQFSEACQFALAGDRSTAEQIDHRLKPIHEALFIESNPITVKWALHIMGLIDRGIRLPLVELSEEIRFHLVAAMKKADIAFNEHNEVGNATSEQ